MTHYLPIKSRKDLEKKRFLNFTELMVYLGLSRNLLEQIIKKDPSFPSRKTPRYWARVQIDEWEKSINNPWWFERPKPQLTATANRFALDIESLN